MLPSLRVMNLLTTRQNMGVIDIKPSRYTPAVRMDAENCIFEIRGISMPEDALEFYNPIIDWVKTHEFCKDDKSSINFYLDYFNTSSAKMILELLITIDTLFTNGNDIEIVWNYQEEDEQLKEVGEEYAQLLQVPLELRLY